MGITTYLSNKLLDSAVANVSYSTPESVYLSLHSTLSNATVAGTELSGNGYARQEITFGSASNGSIIATANVTFTASGANWDNAVSSGIYDNLTGGNMLFFYNIVPKTVLDGTSIEVVANNIRLSIV